jgi:hypothetical protein
MLNTALSLNTSAALETYVKTLSGKRISDLEQNPELRNFVKE